MTTLRKIRDTPSGSAGNPSSSWPLYNCASFLLDTKDNHASIQSSYPLRPIENLESSFTQPFIGMVSIETCRFVSFHILIYIQSSNGIPTRTL